MLLCQQHGHNVVALANLCPAVGAPDELDSFMFQTVGHQLVAALAACAELPMYRRRIGGASRHMVRTVQVLPCLQNNISRYAGLATALMPVLLHRPCAQSTRCSDYFGQSRFEC